MIGFLYTGDSGMAKTYDRRLYDIFGFKVNNEDISPKDRAMYSKMCALKDGEAQRGGVCRYLCVNSNKMLFSHSVMSGGKIIPQKNPDVNFYITVNVRSPKTLEFVRDVHSMQEIWHDFGLCPQGTPLPEATELAFDLFDSRVSYSELNEEVKYLCGDGFSIERSKWGGGIQCYYQSSPCTVEDLFVKFERQR